MTFPFLDLVPDQTQVRIIRDEPSSAPFKIGDVLTFVGFDGDMLFKSDSEKFVQRRGTWCLRRADFVIVGQDEAPSERPDVLTDDDEQPGDFACAECGVTQAAEIETAGIATFVVTVLLDGSRTEVCRDCDNRL